MSTAFGRIGRGFLIGAAAALAAAGFAYLLLPAPAREITAGVLGLLALISGIQGLVWTVLQRRMFGSPAALARVAQDGRPAVAEIRTIDSTSSSIGANPVLRLGLTIDGRPREHRVVAPAHLLSSIRPGARLPVRVDATDPRLLVVEWARVR